VLEELKLRLSILISGTGGQGVILAGELLSRAFFKAGYEVINTHSYGAEARGGACKSELLISDEEIYDISLADTDVFIAMSAPAYTRYIHQAKTGSLVLLEEEVAQELKKMAIELKGDVETVSIPAKSIAQNLGDVIVTNMVIIGALLKKTSHIELEIIKSVIEESMSPAVRDINLKALERGYSSLT